MDNINIRYDERLTWRKQLKETMLLLSLLVTPGRGVRRLYDMYSTNNYFTEQSLYLNNGYWRGSPQTLDEACQAMARLVGETVDMGAGDEVLDVGFGFGDQDLFWMRKFNPKRIVGLNITPSQVELARKRIAEQQLEDRIDLRVGSATEMPFEAESFDKVVAVEAAMHFVTREKFFHEAFRVLRPGGRIATTDIVPLPSMSRSIRGVKALKARLKDYMNRSLGATPSANLYPPDVYARKLEGAGFQNVRVVSIREHVFLPFVSYLSRRRHDQELLRRYNPVLRIFMQIIFKLPGNSAWDYVFAVGDKPAHRQ